jgi:hypothetical protein
MNKEETFRAIKGNNQALYEQPRGFDTLQLTQTLLQI